jgi:hypothetical protein
LVVILPRFGSGAIQVIGLTQLAGWNSVYSVGAKVECIGGPHEKDPTRYQLSDKA